MAGVRISDIIVPEVFIPYMDERTAELSSLLGSGIMVTDPKLDELAASGGTIINMPFFQDLTGDDEVLADDTDLTPGKLTTAKDMARLHLRGRAWGSHDLAKALAGADPMASIANKVAEYWNRRFQAVLVATLRGVFADNVDNDSSDLLLNVSIAAGLSAVAANKISATNVLAAKQLLGDSGGKFVGVAMHSSCYTDLQTQNLIVYIPNARGEVNIPTYLGYRVIVDDGCYTVAGGTNGFVSQVYLFTAGAIGFGNGGAPVPIETDRDSLGSEDLLITRKHFLMHPQGFAWTEGTIAGEAPTNAELALAAHWSRVAEKKNCGVVCLTVNL